MDFRSCQGLRVLVIGLGHAWTKQQNKLYYSLLVYITMTMTVLAHELSEKTHCLNCYCSYKQIVNVTQTKYKIFIHFLYFLYVNLSMRLRYWAGVDI